MSTNRWTRPVDEIVALSRALLRSDCGLGISASERLVLIFRLLTEGGEPLSRAVICAVGRMSRETLSEINATLERKGLVESEVRPGKATIYRSTMPADVMAKIEISYHAFVEAKAADPAVTGPGASHDPAATGPGVVIDTPYPAVTGPGGQQNLGDYPAATGPGAPPTRPSQGRVQPDPAFTGPGGGAAEPPHLAATGPGQGGDPAATRPGGGVSEPAHMTTRAHDASARADHHHLSSRKEGRKVERSVSVSGTQPSMFDAAEAGPDHCRVNGKAISWLDPTDGSPQALSFRLLETSISNDPQADPAQLREWARREIDLAIAEGKNGNLSRWLRHVFTKSWPRFKSERTEPERLAKFAPTRRISDKLEPWEG